MPVSYVYMYIITYSECYQIRFELNPMYDCVHHDNIDSKNSLALYGTYPFKFSLILNF